MEPRHRAATAVAILSAGLLLGVFAGFPAEALHWQAFTDAYEDTVVVTRAEYREGDHELRVRAESSSPTAVLSVYDGSGALIGVLERKSATEHEGRFAVQPNPLVITVRSSEGGHATVLVVGDDPPTVTPAASPTRMATATETLAATPTATAAGPGETPTTTPGAPGPTATPTAGAPGPSATPTAGGPVLDRGIALPLVLDRVSVGDR